MTPDSHFDSIPDCPDCDQSLRHCHGVLIRHESLELECMNGDACPRRRIDVHAVVLSCRELQPPCGC